MGSPERPQTSHLYSIGIADGWVHDVNNILDEIMAQLLAKLGWGLFVMDRGYVFTPGADLLQRRFSRPGGQG
jgi:hypothetical protein